MTAAAGALTPRQASRLQAAMALLRAGRKAEALAAARDLASEVAHNGNIQQLLAMCLAEAGQEAAAELAFRRAIVLSAAPGTVALNLARWLGRLGRVEDALQVLAEAPENDAGRLQQGLLALRAGRAALAGEAFSAVVERDPTQAQAWHGLGQARRALGDWEGAESAFDQATRLTPGDAPAWINRAAVLRLLGRLDEALLCLDHAERSGYAGPELADLRNGIWHDAGRTSQALAGARALVRRCPEHVEAHASLAQLLWQRADPADAAQDPFAEFLRAARAQPRHRGLHLRLAAMLTAAARADDALAVLAALEGAVPDDPVLQWFRADAHARLGQHGPAGELYQSAHGALHRHSSAFLNAHARHGFRVGAPELALRCASDAIALDPRDQEAWAHRATAWRLLGDAREFWLCDYDGLIGEVEVELPVGREALPGFLPQLEAGLRALHQAGHEPLDQSVRHGSQTPGRLFGRNDPLLVRTEQALRRAVDDWIARLPEDPRHPFLSRRGSRVRFVGSWSVRLRSSGRHSNHIHNEGWLSSAFYVALPSSLRRKAAPGNEGWIQFGQPLEDLGLDLPPRRMIQPQPGKLVLFPSYMWHGTVPFSDVEDRLTIAFDAQPA